MAKHSSYREQNGCWNCKSGHLKTQRDFPNELWLCGTDESDVVSLAGKCKNWKWKRTTRQCEHCLMLKDVSEFRQVQLRYGYSSKGVPQYYPPMSMCAYCRQSMIGFWRYVKQCSLKPKHPKETRLAKDLATLLKGIPEPA